MKNSYFLLIALSFFNLSNAQVINFPDPVFKQKLMQSGPGNSIAKNLADVNIKIDANNNGLIEISEAAQVGKLNLIPTSESGFATSLVGIANFVNLTQLYCSNEHLTSLDLTALTQLVWLDCKYNQLTSLNIQGLSQLKIVDCVYNSLPSLNLSGLSSLLNLKCYNNQLTSLTLAGMGLSNVNDINCSHNNITSLNVSGLPLLYTLSCNSNQLTSLTFSNVPVLSDVYCGQNALTTLDCSETTALSLLSCTGNNLVSVFIKNGRAETLELMAGSNIQSMRYICADESQMTTIQNSIAAFPNCHANSYCSFTPGGTFYTINGNTKYDSTSNGCDASDDVIPNVKYSFNSGTNVSNITSNATSNYLIPVGAGTYSVAPILEIPSYFNVSPTSVNVSFPTAASPLTQNFCVAPNGTHNDLEIAFFPIGPARPGFDAKYKMVYKNKGTATQSGTINLSYEDDLIDFVSATQSVSIQSAGSLNWDFSNLKPFESREMTLLFNLNSPQETPPTNSGTILHYYGSISGLVDETPQDNSVPLVQNVVNGMDPNDKTCTEGSVVALATVGNYVHYVIRFENTGTYAAENIVVRDMIDTAKYDVNSIVALNASHPFVSRRIGANQVEFIFENINLPFDDANNDGYVAFKIKTKSNLAVGNTFSNSANIYFDYNFPITTNTYTTTIQALANPDFEFGTYFTIAPNPVKDQLAFQTKEGVAISSISIYNTLGQLVLVVTEPNSNIDVSSLKSGNYFLKIISNKGSSSSKFIKL